MSHPANDPWCECGICEEQVLIDDTEIFDLNSHDIVVCKKCEDKFIDDWFGGRHPDS